MSAKTNKKEFDCVEFKRQMQENVRQAYAGLSDEERREKMEQGILNGPLGDFWRRISAK